MKFAYADPPYLGQGKKLYGKHHPEAAVWDTLEAHSGRRITREQPTVKDHVIESITLKKGLTGAKPVRFCEWVIAALNVEPDVFARSVFGDLA